MDRCDDINKSCIKCANADIEFWDDIDHFYCTFACPHNHKDTGTIIGFLKKHTCFDFKAKEN